MSPWEGGNHRVTMGKCRNHRVNMGRWKPQSHHRRVETTESPWEGVNHGVVMESPWEGGNQRVTMGM